MEAKEHPSTFAYFRSLLVPARVAAGEATGSSCTAELGNTHPPERRLGILGIKVREERLSGLEGTVWATIRRSPGALGSLHFYQSPGLLLGLTDREVAASNILDWTMWASKEFGRDLFLMACLQIPSL